MFFSWNAMQSFIQGNRRTTSVDTDAPRGTYSGQFAIRASVSPELDIALAQNLLMFHSQALFGTRASAVASPTAVAFWWSRGFFFSFNFLSH